ncbi:MAG: flagellar hook-basal body complex protein FliE [Desulfobacterales bacterium]
MKVDALTPGAGLGGLTPVQPAAQEPKAVQGFGEVMENAINGVDRLQKEANQSIQALADGSVQDLHQTMIAMEKASVSFKLVMEVRNKMVEAYQEIMRMQV